MKKSRMILLAAILAAGGLGLAACSSGSSGSGPSKVGDFKVAYKNPNKAIKGGNLKMAYVSDSPFKAQWVADLATDATFASMTTPAGYQDGVFYQDVHAKYIKGGPANISFDDKAKTATVTLRDNLKWSNGSQVTAKDYEFNYEVEANPAYQSQRWQSGLSDIVGMDAYHEGKANTISGVTYPDGADGKVVKIQFKEMKPSMHTVGNGIIGEYVVPYQYLKDVAPKNLMSSPKTTTKPVVTGPFMPSKIVNGESIKYVPNPYYWGKKPKLDSITYSTVSPDSTAASVKAHKYDIVMDAMSSSYKDVKNAKGYVITGNEEYYLSLMYFNLGKFDSSKSVSVQDRKTPLQDVKVRQAIGYARNVADVQKKFSNGLAQTANSVFPTVYGLDTKNIKGYEKQDLGKAKKLLDEAGWKMNKSTGYREKDGKTLSLVYAARQGDANSETIAQNYIQQWKKVGIKVSLYHGKLMEFNSWIEHLTNPPGTNDWDMTDGAWSLTGEPSQDDLFGANAALNMGHFNDPQITKDMEAINSQKAMNATYRSKAFVKYAEDMNKKAYVIPTAYAIDYTPVNKRVVGWTQSYAENNNTFYENVGVSSNSMATK